MSLTLSPAMVERVLRRCEEVLAGGWHGGDPFCAVLGTYRKNLEGDGEAQRKFDFVAEASDDVGRMLRPPRLSSRWFSAPILGRSLVEEIGSCFLRGDGVVNFALGFSVSWPFKEYPFGMS
ncbi:hypothetical protein FOZ60_006881 [Perkinsus olseni]|uniref:Uncharacterized protein n=1 Tax=Perkinsus olseni TaxID=32597 RepID=A0A7J6NMI7_PEROL|nr:hypothetical protein FOZ60_006881 [Perkinsus olseni]